jgi:uncharacterized protein (TIGR02996 family)
MQLDRTFKKGATEVVIKLVLDKDNLETTVVAGGKEKKKSTETSSFAFKDYAKLVQKQLKDGLEAVPLKDPAKVAGEMMAVKDLDLDLADTLEAFPPAERPPIVALHIPRADKAKTLIGGDAYPHVSADIFAKCPTPELLRHLIGAMLDGRISKLSRDFFATAMSNAAREPDRRGWIAAEVEAVLPKADPDLRKWLLARVAKFREQTKTQAQLATAAPKEAAGEEGLLEEIGKHPDDDAPRQVWADWLLEHGNKWGEAVQAQCEV